jgi:hypothetical protein
MFKNEGKPFAAEDMKHLTLPEIEQAIKGLLAKGLIEVCEIVDGKEKYKLTALGRKVNYHIGSNPSTRN